MTLHDWSPIATHAISHGRTAFWFRSSPATFLVTCDDGITDQVWYWSGTDWSDNADDARDYTHREDAELELRAARDGIHDKRREFVAVEEF